LASKKISAVIIVVAILFIIYIGFFISSDFDKIRTILLSIEFTPLLIGIGFWSLGVLVRGLRWHFFLQQVERKIPFRANMLYYLAGLSLILTPGRLGEAIRSPIMKRDYGVSISKSTSIMFFERFSDMIGLLILMSVGLLFVRFDSIIIIPISIIVAAVIIFKNKNLLNSIINKIPKVGFLKNFDKNFEELYETINTLLKSKFVFMGSGLGILSYLFQTIAVYFFVLSLNTEISLEKLLVVFPTSMFAAAVSLIPAGVGVFEGGMVGLLVLYEISYEAALSTTIIIRLVSIGIFSIVGIICLKIISK